MASVACIAAILFLLLGMHAASAQPGVVIERVNFVGLSAGSDEKRVSALKEILNTIPVEVSAGCASLGPANTKYGPTTEACVTAFQRMNGLAQTGVVDEGTNRILNEVMGTNLATMPVARSMAVIPKVQSGSLAAVNTAVTLQSLYALLEQLQKQLKMMTQ